MLLPGRSDQALFPAEKQFPEAFRIVRKGLLEPGIRPQAQAPVRFRAVPAVQIRCPHRPGPGRQLFGRFAGHPIIHSRPYQPEGRGKIERCFRTVREQFLANLDPKRLLSLEQLNERLQAWIESVCHRAEHSALGTTPLLRWQKDIEQVRQLPPGCDLHRLFFHRLDRLVRRDSTFLLRNRLYEAPPHLAGHTVEVRFDPVEGGAVEVWFEGKLQAAARPLDPVVNGRLPSTKPAAPAPPEPTGINFVELVHEKKQEDDEEDVPW